MQTRWMLIVLTAAVVVTLVTFLPIAPGHDAANPVQQGAEAVAGPGCGADAPAANLDLTLENMHGRQIRLADLRGKVILLNFWATWCAPCRLEIPHFVELQEKYRAQGLEVVGVSVDDPIEDLAPFAEEFRVNYQLLVGLGREDVQDAFGPIYGVPTSFLIGRNGRICYHRPGLASKEEFEREIRSLL